MKSSKKIFFLIILSLPFFFFACVPKDTCRISIEAKNYPVDAIQLLWAVDSQKQRDTIQLKDGKGTIDIHVPDLTSLQLYTNDKSKEIITEDGYAMRPVQFLFFAENGKKVTIQFDNNEWPAATISGGKVNNDYARLWEKNGKLNLKVFELLQEIYSTNDPNIQEAKQNELGIVHSKVSENEEHFIEANPDSYVSLYLLANRIFASPILEFASRFLALDKEIQNTEKGKQLYENILNIKRTLVGLQAPEFSAKDKDGNVIRSSDLKGKYVLIDFWGTWCGPCRASHPHLIQLHEKYASKGVEFINIAQERGNGDLRPLWLEAIKDDGLVWTQILNNEQQVDLVSLFGIMAFPTKVLIDKDGKIIGKYTGYVEKTGEIDEKLKEIFGE